MRSLVCVCACLRAGERTCASYLLQSHHLRVRLQLGLQVLDLLHVSLGHLAAPLGVLLGQLRPLFL